MTRARTALAAVLTFAISAGVAMASWYDDYEAGTAAARKGQWSVVIQKMNAALAGNPKENDKARTYSTIFINYHPYYYRGVAYLSTGKLEQAVSDFERTSGPGDVDLGPLEALMQRAKTKLEAASAAPAQEQPAPQPAPAPRQAVQQPAPTSVPAAPTIDPALRQRVASQIAAASASLAKARTRNAGSSPQYQQAVQALAEANAKSSTAKSNDDLSAALAFASNAGLFADSAVAPGLPAPAVAARPTSRPIAAADEALADSRRALRIALTDYFNGDFEAASRGFETLSHSMPGNGWIWAFLGASKYSQYAFEADDAYKQAAAAAFKRAKASPHLRRGLPERYFSKRVRKFFNSVG